MTQEIRNSFTVLPLCACQLFSRWTALRMLTEGRRPWLGCAVSIAADTGAPCSPLSSSLLLTQPVESPAGTCCKASSGRSLSQGTLRTMAGFSPAASPSRAAGRGGFRAAFPANSPSGAAGEGCLCLSPS